MAYRVWLAWRTRVALATRSLRGGERDARPGELVGVDERPGHRHVAGQGEQLALRAGEVRPQRVEVLAADVLAVPAQVQEVRAERRGVGEPGDVGRVTGGQPGPQPPGQLGERHDLQFDPGAGLPLERVDQLPGGLLVPPLGEGEVGQRVLRRAGRGVRTGVGRAARGHGERQRAGHADRPAQSHVD